MYISASAPEAPPFSVTTIGCFIRLFFWIAACIIRAIWSDAPPAPAATTISTGLVGSHAASELVANAHAVNAAAKAIFLLIGLLLLVSDEPRRLAGRALSRSRPGTPSPPLHLPVSPARRRARDPSPRRPTCPSA